MHHGVVMFPTEYSIAPDELARALEERGFDPLSISRAELTRMIQADDARWVKVIKERRITAN